MPLTFLSPLHRANRQISLYFEGAMQDMNVSPQEGHILSYLNSYAPVPISELVRVFGLKHSTLSSMLDRLERQGYIGREVNPNDRRSFLVTIAEHGGKLAEILQHMIETLETDIGNAVAKSDIEGFRNVMAAVERVTKVTVRERPS